MARSTKRKRRRNSCPVAKDLRTPKYKKRVVPNKKKTALNQGSGLEEKDIEYD